MIGVKNRGGFVDPSVEDEFEWADQQISSKFLVEHNEDGTHRTPDPQLAIVPLGGCIPYTLPAAAVPRGWLLADGSQVSRVTYKSYFDAVGTTYGVGDGVLTFNIPDLRQRVPLGKAASGTGATLGSTGGAIDHTHTHAHTHDFTANVEEGGTGTFLAEDNNLQLEVTGTTGGVSVGSTGTANPPFLALNFIVYVGV